MRPSSTRKSTPSSATVVLKALRRPRASMQAMMLALLLCLLRCRRRAVRRRIEFFLGQAKPLDRGGNARPLFVQKLFALALEQKTARPVFDKHPEASLRLDELFVHQFLVTLQDREGIDPEFGRNIADRGERIAFVEEAVEDHVNDAVAQLAVNRLTIMPFTFHSVFEIDHCSSCSDVVNYNTSSQASSFLNFFLRRFSRRPTGSNAGPKREEMWVGRDSNPQPTP